MWSLCCSLPYQFWASVPKPPIPHHLVLLEYQCSFLITHGHLVLTWWVLLCWRLLPIFILLDDGIAAGRSLGSESKEIVPVQVFFQKLPSSVNVQSYVKYFLIGNCGALKKPLVFR